MANYASLKSAIQAVIKQNGNNEITGALLQQSLLSMITSLGANYQFAGIATPATNPGTPDQNVFYLAGSGNYVNFGGQTIPVGNIGVLFYNGSWASQSLSISEIGNILLLNEGSDPTVLPDFDTVHMRFKWPPLGGGLFVGNHAYSAPPVNSRTISLLGINSVALKITYDTATTLLSAKAYNATISPTEVVIASLRVDAANNPTKITGISAAFEYTVDGQNDDSRIAALETDLEAAKINLKKFAASRGNVLFLNVNTDPINYPRFTSSNMMFTWPEQGGRMFIGNTSHEALAGGRFLYLTGIDSTAIIIVYNLLADNITAKRFDATLTDDDVIIAIVRTDVADTPTRITNVSALFDYTIDGILREQRFGNILFLAGPTDLPNFNETTMNFRWPSDGGGLFIGNKGYPAPTQDTRVVSLLGINSVAILIIYNIFTHTLRAAAHNASILNDDVVIAVVRTDAVNAPTKILNVSASFNYTINGKNADSRITDLETGMETVNDRIDELETSPEPPMLPYMEIFKSIPSEEINTEFQSFCKVGSEIWIFTGGSGAGGALMGYIYRYTLAWEYIGRFQQNGFHFNSVSYDEITDRLITGQAGDGSNQIYVFNNVSNWPTIHAASPVTSADIERVVVVSQVNNRPNPVWGPRNAYGHRDIFISANLNSRFLKIRLGYGTNQLQYGTYTASADGVPNGTYQLVWNRELTIPQLIYTIAAKIPAYPTAVCQGIAYYKGKIYVMATVTPSTIMEITPTDNALTCRVIYQLWTDDGNNIIENCANEGIMCLDGKMYVGVSAIGVDTQITNYNNKILRFDL